MTVTHDPSKKLLRVNVDRSKIITHGKPSLGRMLCKLHIWRCTADVANMRPWYEELTKVEGEHEQWRRTVLQYPEPRWKFVQTNTVLEGDKVSLKEYARTNEGIIQCFVDRAI